MNFNSTKRYSVTQRRSSAGGGGGGAAILDQTYGAPWGLDTTNGRSAKSIYDIIQLIGYVAGNVAYQNPVGGNDSTAVLGNRLKPFATIGAAIAALGTSTSSALVIMGYNFLDDSNAPYGLKAPNSHYDILAEPGCRVDYYGTYGLYISNATTFGSIFGDVDMRAYSSVYTGAVDGVSNYAFNIGINATPKIIDSYNMISESVSPSSHCLRVGACTATSFVLSLSGRILSRGGLTMLLDTNSRFIGSNIAFIQSTSPSVGMIKIFEPTNIRFYNVVNTQAYANYLGYTQPYCIQITDNAGTKPIEFDNCNITAHETTDGGYKLIEIISSQPSLPNLLFKRTDLRNRFSSVYALTGYSFYSATNISLKIRDVYADRNSGGAGVLTNLISSGNGFMYEPNL